MTGTARPAPDAIQVARQLAHEHGKAYDAIEDAAQRLEMTGAGHAREVVLLRAIRRRLARHIFAGSCDAD